jgi:hypothetical protein
VIGSLKPSIIVEEATVSVVPEVLIPEETPIVALRGTPPTPLRGAGSTVSDVVSHPSPASPLPVIEATKEQPLTLPKGSTRPQKESEKRREQSLSTLVFGNADHIQLVRLRRSKANVKRAVKKPRVQVEVKEIPAMVAEEQPQQKAASNKKTTQDQGQTLWDFLAQEPFPEPAPERVVSPVLVVEPQQLTLF